MSSQTPHTTFLLVDDDALFRDGFERLIRGLRLSSNPRCLHAEGGAEALALVKERIPHLVFLDYMMPGLSGLQCLRRLREAHEHMPIIMITGAGDEHVAVDAMKAGAMDYLIKGSITPESLKRAIVNALQKANLLMTIREQQEALLDAERHRVMIASLAAACHHMGQPATVIRGYLELLRKEASPPAAQEMIHHCLDAADAMTDVMQRLRAVCDYRTVPYLTGYDKDSEDALPMLDI